VSAAWPWLAVAGLGAYHGLDPSMGWLFAVALGLQEKSRSRVLKALWPIGIGHLVAIALIIAIIGGFRAFFTIDYIRPAGAAVLIVFGIFRFLWPRAHPRWVAMRVNAAELALWSFLMATAHGAGLMLFPIVLRIAPDMCLSPSTMNLASHSLFDAAAIVVLHTGSMLIVMGAVALVVYGYVGLAILRRAWINLDTIWAGALVAAGLLSLAI
jgi:hypothetical protein